MIKVLQEYDYGFRGYHFFKLPVAVVNRTLNPKIVNKKQSCKKNVRFYIRSPFLIGFICFPNITKWSNLVANQQIMSTIKPVCLKKSTHTDEKKDFNLINFFANSQNNINHYFTHNSTHATSNIHCFHTNPNESKKLQGKGRCDF